MWRAADTASDIPGPKTWGKHTPGTWHCSFPAFWTVVTFLQDTKNIYVYIYLFYSLMADVISNKDAQK